MSDILTQIHALGVALRTGDLGRVSDPAWLAECIDRFEAAPDKGLNWAFGLVREPGKRKVTTEALADRRWSHLRKLHREFYPEQRKTPAASAIERDARQHLARGHIPPTVSGSRRREYAELLQSAVKSNGEAYTARELVKHLDEVNDGSSLPNGV